MFSYIKTALSLLSIVKWLYGIWERARLKREALAEVREEQKKLAKAQQDEAKKVDTMPVSNDKHDILNGL